MSQPLSLLQMGTGLRVTVASPGGGRPVALLQKGFFATRRQSGVVVGVCGRTSRPEAASQMPTDTARARAPQSPDRRGRPWGARA